MTPQRILAALQAYRDSAALHTAIELDLFTRIAHGTDTAHKIAGEMGIPVRGVRLLCEYLATAGLLEKEDEQLKLTPDGAHFLDRKSPAYIGDSVGGLCSPHLLQDFARLTEAVRAGHSVSPAPAVDGRPDWFDLARGVTDPHATAAMFAEAVSLPEGQPLKILDVGARDGRFGIALATRYPNSIVVALDLPAALKTAMQNAQAARLSTRYQNIPGDPLLAPLGLQYDAVLIAENLFQFDAAQITSLFRRIHHALKKSGQLIILEFLAEDAPEFTREFAGYRLNLLAATTRGDAYTLAEVNGMLETSGFHSIEARPLPGAGTTLMAARP